MNEEKKEALLLWVCKFTSAKAISSVPSLKDGELFLKILAKSDADFVFEPSTPENNVDRAVAGILERFGSWSGNLIDVWKIHNGDELEIGKVLCLLLEVMLTAENNEDNVAIVQELPNNVQRVLMGLCSLVMARHEDAKLGDLIIENLRLGGFSTALDDSSLLTSSVEDMSPVPWTSSSPVIHSPHAKTGSSTDVLQSPILAVLSSPQAIVRKVMSSNNKLMAKVRYSEMHVKNKVDIIHSLESDVDQKEKRNESLESEMKVLRRRLVSLQDSEGRLKDDMGFLEQQLLAKDEELTKLREDLKSKKDLVGHLQGELSLAQKSHIDWEKECSSKEKTIVEFQAKMNLSENNACNLGIIVESLRSKLSDKEEALLALQTKFEKIESEASDNAAVLETTIAKLRQDMTSMEMKYKDTQSANLAESMRLTELERQLHEANLKCSQLQAKADGAEFALKALELRSKEELERRDSRVLHLEGELSKLKMESAEALHSKDDIISRLKKDLLDGELKYKAAMSDSSSEIEKCRSDLREQLEERDMVIERLNKLNSANEAKLSGTTESLNIAQEKVREGRFMAETLNSELERQKHAFEAEIRLLQSTAKQSHDLSEADKGRLQGEIGRLGLQLERTVLEHAENLRKERENFDRCERQKDQLVSKIESLEKHRNEHVDQISNLLKQVQELTAGSCAYTSKINTLQEQCSAHEKTCEELERKISELAKIHHEEKQKWETKRKSLDTHVSVWEANCGSLKKQLDAKSSQLSATEESLKATEERLQASKLELETVSGQLSERALEESLLRVERDKIYSELNRTKTELTLEKQNLENYVRDFNDCSAKLTAATTETEKLQTQVDDMRKQLSDNEKKYQEKIQAFQSELVLQVSTYKNQELASAAVQAKLQEATLASEALEAKHNTLQSHCDSLASENDRCKKELKQLQVEHEETLQQLKKACSANTQFLSDMDALKREHELTVNTLSTANKSLEERLLKAAEQGVQNKKSYEMKINEMLSTVVENMREFQEVKRMLGEKEADVFRLEEEVAALKKVQSNANVARDELEEVLQAAHQERDAIAVKLASAMKDAHSMELTIRQLEEQCIEEQVISKRSAGLLRSAEAENAASTKVILDLKAEIKQLKEALGSSSQKHSKPIVKAEADVSFEGESGSPPEDDGGRLSVRDMRSSLRNTKSGDLASTGRPGALVEESSSLHAHQKRRSLQVMSLHAEVDSSGEHADTESDPTMARTYSLRNAGENRRRSLVQPRRYLSGHTPPRRRTLLGLSSQAQVSNFDMEECAEEEESFRDVDWGVVARLKEEKQKELSTSITDAEGRLAELQRRNTLCLPHLKSTYATELRVDDIENIPSEAILAAKRKAEPEPPRGTFKRCRTDTSLHSVHDATGIVRSTRSDSVLRPSRSPASRGQAHAETAGDRAADSSSMTASGHVSFDVILEPAKNPKQRMTRSRGSTNLVSSAQAEDRASPKKGRLEAKETRSSPKTKAARPSMPKPTQGRASVPALTTASNSLSRVLRATAVGRGRNGK